MRTIIFLVLSALLVGCVTPKAGMTMDEYRSKCKVAFPWAEITSLPLSTGQTVLMCADADSQVFSEAGILEEVLSKDQVVALLEHDRCKSFGLSPGEQSYVNCRLTLAQIRAQQEAIARAKQQQAAQALMNYSLMLQSINQPQTVNIQANCTSYQMGNYVHYTCR